MGRLILRLIIISFALWLVTVILNPNIRVESWSTADDTAAYLVALVLVALVFGVVNAVVGGVIRVVAFPLYILTLGLISFLVNGLLLLIVAWLSSVAGFGLYIEGFWWGVLGALLLGIFSWVIGIVLRPFTRTARR